MLGVSKAQGLSFVSPSGPAFDQGGAASHVSAAVMRTGPLIGAAGVTLGLIALMSGLIAEDFVPQDVVKLAAFELNPQAKIIEPITERIPPEMPQPVEIPPAPPPVEKSAATKPAEPISKIIAPNTAFDPTVIIPTQTIAVIQDRDPTPLVRVTPVMPIRAERSGHCRVAFDISAEGRPFNVRAQQCSQRVFERSAVASVQKWTYRSEIRGGQPVARSGLETTIWFQLLDERGNIIPE